MTTTRNVFVLAVAVIIGLVVKQLNTKKGRLWHEGLAWKHFLGIYDGLVQSNFAGCNSRLVESKFGFTQIHACGDINASPVFFLHGAASCSHMWGDWLMPTLSKQFYTVFVDTCGDTGRTLPKDGDPANCPKDREQTAEWIVGIASSLGIKQPVSLVGYSYGSFLASEVALSSQSDKIDKLVLMAPAAVFAPIVQGWTMRALGFRFVHSLVPLQYVKDAARDWFFDYMMADPDVSFKDTDREWLALSDAGYEAAWPHLVMTPESLADDALEKMANTHPTLLVIGEGETVLNASMACERAEKAGAKVQLYQQAGHMLLMEHPGQHVVGVTAEFLSDSSKSLGEVGEVEAKSSETVSEEVGGVDEKNSAI